MRVKLAVLDVDGTLLDPTGEVSPRVREAVRAARARGCLVTLASGRRLWAVRPIVAALGLDLPVILYNGALVFDVGREELLSGAHLHPGLLRHALDLVWSAGFQPVVYESPRWGERIFTGLEEQDTPATRYYFDRPTVQATRLPRSELAEVREPLLLAAMGAEADVRDLQRTLTSARLACDMLVERQSFVPGSPWWQLDLTAPSCSKGEALRRLCELAGVGLHETLAVGDGINDLELIRAAGVGVAMGNAVDEVKAAASALVADNAHDGAAEAIERFVLQPDGEPASARAGQAHSP